MPRAGGHARAPGLSSGRLPHASRLDELVDRVSHLLPAQGPIRVFIHHNTLHAFEDLPFEDAAVVAGQRLGCEPFLSEDRYREELARGRIEERDVRAELSRRLGERASDVLLGTVRRGEIRERVLLEGIPEARGAALEFALGETDVLADPPARELFAACVRAVRRASPATPVRGPALRRHRDLLLAAYGVDTDEQIHPVLIRFVASFLDQGLAQWAMPRRWEGMYECFVDTYGSSLARLCAPWGRELVHAVTAERALGGAGLASLARSLEVLGVASDEQEVFLGDTVLALRGWAGMVRQIEERPDRVPALAVPATLVDFLAVRLLFERAAIARAAREQGIEAPLHALRDELRSRLPARRPPSDEERAWLLCHAVRLLRIDADAIDAASPSEIDAFLEELAEHDGIERRRVLHLAYERRLRHRFYDALGAHGGAAPSDAPTFQTISCLDEREESFRRHLEEADPEVETFGAAGFYRVAMYYRGATDAHPRPLCPVAVRPAHYVREVEEESTALAARVRRLRERSAGLVDKNVHVASRTLVRGTVLMAVLGVLSVVPLVFRVVFPWLGRRLARLDPSAASRARTRISVDREERPPPIGEHAGFTVDEMAAIVRAQLEDIGAADRLAPLVIVLGHGSSSLNNPHESAHDCGACGGGRGGPNARAFARMANDSRVRAALAETGLEIPSSTWFVGGERNTSSNEVPLFDTELVPDAIRPVLARAREALDRARQTEAHERCRRFVNVPRWFPPAAALLHVEARAVDLAQPRPEYGHATNAFCVLGRRSRTRGLFLDRRAFLASYDPTRDPDGTILARLLAALVPVVAGISLEYYFGYVDPTGYGSGTKLPHNVACLLGVMDGAQSDLRSGLPWQMLEIHEPVRLSLVVEARPELLERIVAENADLARLVRNRWLRVACLDPGSNAIWELTDGGPQRYEPEATAPVVRGRSAECYRGERDHLPFYRIEAGSPARSSA